MNAPAQCGDIEAGSRTVALYWAAGTYPEDLFNRLNNSRAANFSIHVLSHMRNPARKYAVPFHRVTTFGNFQDTLRENKITDILFAGGFSLASLFRGNFLGFASMYFRRDPVAAHFLHSSGFLDGAREKDFWSGSAFLRAVQMMLEDSGVKVISPHDLIDDYKGCDGENGGAQGYHGDVQIDEYANKVKLDLGEKKRSIRQAHVVSLNFPLVSERHGTKRLLKDFSVLNAGETYRLPVLVKLPARGFNVRLDMPLIGPDTIEQCKKGHIRGIIFCPDFSILYKKDELFEAAMKESQFFLQGLSANELREIFKDDPVYLAGL